MRHAVALIAMDTLVGAASLERVCVETCGEKEAGLSATLPPPFCPAAARRCAPCQLPLVCLQARLNPNFAPLWACPDSVPPCILLQAACVAGMSRARAS